MANQILLGGIGASAGIAQGKVKIIKNKADRQNFNAGDILVTKTTDPSMVVLMGKAAAIVTDIGGLTSHPAIVSREMGIPCVVATKEATAKLKDGMDIIVDGSQGKVYLANNSKSTSPETTNKIKETITESPQDDIALDDNSKSISTETSDKDYDDWMQAMRQGFAKMDFETMNIAVVFDKIDPLIAKPWIKKLQQLLARAKQELTFEEIGQLLHTPSILRSLGLFDLFMASIADLSIDQKKEIGNFYIQALKTMCLKDPFALNGNNLIHAKEKISQKAQAAQMANPEIAKKLGRLINACYHISYSLYGDMNPQLVYESYGPYEIQNKNGEKYTGVIKEFSNLKPVEIWPEMAELPFEKISITNLYQRVKFSMDAITHSNYSGDIINGLKYASIEVDGKHINFDQIDQLTEQIEHYAQMIWEKVQQLNTADYNELYLHQKAYNYKQLCDRLDIDWLPTPEMIEQIRNNPYKVWPKFSSAQEANEFLIKIIDPRNNFAG